MSFKKYFDKAETIKSLSNKSAEEIASQVESVGYHQEDIVEEERFIPNVDFSMPENFARYGSAEEYYDQAIKRIYEDYPYDGSLREKLKWQNESTYLDLHVFNNLYPRTNGYINLSVNGSATSGVAADGYGRPDDPEYIFFKGGPNPADGGPSPFATHFTGSNYYESALNRENNLKFDLKEKGTTVEFWLKKPGLPVADTSKEVVFDLWNNATIGDADYGRLRIAIDTSGDWMLTVLSGTTGVSEQLLSVDSTVAGYLSDDSWHHYAFSFMSASAGVDTKMYVDGSLRSTYVLGTAGINEVTGALVANIGGLVTNPDGAPAASPEAIGAGKLSGSLDEFRYWKTKRTGKDVGRYWFTQVGGGVNSDPTPFVETVGTANTDLGVYYKFNEGITGKSSTDSVVLDYSGRISNGAWTGYTAAAESRNTGSAIVDSSAATKEFLDPIIYSFHPSVSALANNLQLTGSSYDVNNNAQIYNSIPTWIIEEDAEGQAHLRKLTQIMSSYFDTLQLQVESLTGLKDVSYVSGSDKPLPFAEKLLASSGLVAPEIFIDADVLEKLADRSEDKVFEKSLHDIKNTIYKNIYNNLIYIYKSKGTEKSFRNLIRCFGIDDELIKLNMYANNVEYEVRSNRQNVAIPDKYINFNTANNSGATVYQFQDPTDTTNTTGYFPANTELTGGYAQTFEANITFPKKLSEESPAYAQTNTISASLFGVHGTAEDESDLTWDTQDATNFQVYAVRDELLSDNVRFVLTGTAGGYVPSLVSDLYEDTYNDTNWNLAVRIKPENYPLSSQVVGGASGNYTVELCGIQIDAGVILNEFTISETITSPPAAFVTGSKRAYIGAHHTDFNGTLLQPSDVRINSCRYWFDYLERDTLAGHAYDAENYGSLQPHFYAYSFNPSTAPTGEILKLDTLALNWDFSQNTGSDASGQFAVADRSSGSADLASSRFGWLGSTLSKQHTGRGDLFAASSIEPVEKDFIVSSKLQLPENVYASDMVNVLSAQDQQEFTRDSRPINYFFAFEKSMAQSLSVEMINYFATIRDISTIIGAPVNRYRPNYKTLGILRQRFFERVSNNEIDFNKFYEFYKWFDSALTMMLDQLIPASAAFADNIRTVIESHMLERSKYQHKFQNVKRQLNNIEGTAVGAQVSAEQSLSPEDDPTGVGIYSANAVGKRQIGTSQPINFNSWNLIHAPMSTVVENPGVAKSLLFDGADEYVNIGTAATWDALIGGAGAAAKAFSFSFWVKPTAWGDSTPGFITFGALDRGLVCNSGTGPGNTRLFAKLDTGGSYGSIASAGALTIDVWQHVTVTYAGGNTVAPKIYVNASETAYDVQSAGSPQAIASEDCVIGADGTAEDRCLAGNMCDVAVWDKELSSVEITEIYGSGTRVKLSTTSCQSNLLSWWKLGNGVGDTYNGTMDDEVGGRDGTPTNFDSSSDIEEDSPAFFSPYDTTIGNGQDKKTIWWRTRVERGENVISSSVASVNTNKQTMLISTRNTNDRATNAPYRFGASGVRTLGGIGTSSKKRVNFVYQATTPFGSLRNGAPVNVMVGTGSAVEQLINTSDDFHPAYKQRLGFDLDPDVNKNNDGALKNDGNMLAPFSIYSSSVDTGYNATVVENYAPGIMITDVHHDLVYGGDVPLQSPFTEKYVGGRAHRHVGINDGTDTPSTRPEGWKIKFEGVSSSAGSTFSNSLAVVPPNYDASNALGYNKDIPIANRLRNVGTKRPVNIENIQMRTGSTIIGNYEKNYQVVNTAGRTNNDPFFRDQSFDFAIFPETLATRGRFPLTIEADPVPTKTTDYINTSGVYMDGDGGGNNFSTNTLCYTASVAGGSPTSPGELLVSASTCTVSIWFSASANTVQEAGTPVWRAGSNRLLFAWGGDDGGQANRRIYLRSGSHDATPGNDGRPTLNVSVIRNGFNMDWQSEQGLFTTPGWYNVVVGLHDLDNAATDPDFLTASAAYGGVYVNGVSASVDPNTAYVKGTGYALSGTEANAAASIFASPNAGVYRTDTAFISSSLGSVAYWTGQIAGESLATIAPTLTGSNATGSAEVAAGCSTAVSGGTNIGPLTLTNTTAYDYNYSTNLSSWWTFFDFDVNDGGEDVVGSVKLKSVVPLGNTTAYTDVFTHVTFGTDDLQAAGGGTWYNTYSGDDSACPNPGGSLDYELPERTGSASNETVIVTRYAGSGYEVMSRGYMDPAHEELSVYNANPYHNLSILDYGLSGNVAADPLAAQTITVVDQIDKNRGLDQRYSLHCGPFGSDAAYGSVPSSTYVTTPSYHKVNRNARKRLESGSAGYVTGTVYDNWFVQHAIPRSTQQYAWVTSSLRQEQVIYGLESPSCVSASSLPLMSASAIDPSLLFLGGEGFTRNFVGLNWLLQDPVSSSTHTLGQPLGAALSTYHALATDGLPVKRFNNTVYNFNTLMLHRNGPYGYPMWKQTRAGEDAVARKLRAENKIGQVVPPPTIESATGLDSGKRPNKFVDYVEQPIASEAQPITFAFEDNTEDPDVANNIVLKTSFQNNLDYFTNQGLNSRLGLRSRTDDGNPYNAIADFTLSSSLDTVIKFGQKVFPAAVNAYQTRVRTREDYDISTIWNDVRSLRSLPEGAISSTGFRDPSSSFWPIDSHLDYETTELVAGTGSTAGELLNTYARYSQENSGTIQPAASYVMPLQMGATKTASPATYAIIAGHPWTAPDQAGIKPYQPYVDYASNLRVVGKDMSIVPEFRISELMEEYVNNQSSDFLAKLDNMFSLTGAAISDSSQTNFYKVYSTTDFMKYFKVVDDDLADQANGTGTKLKRHSIELSCEALTQFLPYKGFYPVERTHELAALLSQSLGDFVTYAASTKPVKRRAIYEPLVAPGILFNTIKSGIACSNFVVCNTSSATSAEFDLEEPATAYVPDDADGGLPASIGIMEPRMDSTAPAEWMRWPAASSSFGNNPGFGTTLRMGASSSAETFNGYFFHRLPFEAIRDPERYLSTTAIPGTRFYDTGIFSSSLNHSYGGTNYLGRRSYIEYSGIAKSPLYKLGIDNFLCETYNFFMKTPEHTSFLSKEEASFGTVTKDKYYGMSVRLAVPSDVGGASNLPTTFGMYNRVSSYGVPLLLSGTNYENDGAFDTSNSFLNFEHVLPPSYYGSCNANIILKAPNSGRLSLDDIQGAAVVEFAKKGQFSNIDWQIENYTPGYEILPNQIDSSINILDNHQVVPAGTTAQESRWLIQPKFQTPMLNFADVPAESLVGLTGSIESFAIGTPNLNPGDDTYAIRGMWHQYGNKLSGSEGLYLSIEELPTKMSSSTYGNIEVESLADVVGFDSIEKRIGDFAESKKLEEAIVCVPFLSTKGERRFFDVERDSQEYVTQLALLNKYVFPPTFDPLTHKDVNPIAFYAFEFDMILDQDDLINIWQNLPPVSNSKFDKKTATIKIRSLVDRLLDNDEDLQWMIFKVKRRAEKDYNVYTRKNLTKEGTPIIQPAIDSPYSYNWPYDYCSFVELVKIREEVAYVSEDLIPEQEEEELVIPDLREFIPAKKDISKKSQPRAKTLEVSTEGTSKTGAGLVKKATKPTKKPPVTKTDAQVKKATQKRVIKKATKKKATKKKSTTKKATKKK